MATVTKRLEPHRRMGLSTTPSLVAAQASAATFVKGAPVNITSGYIAAASTTSVNSHSVVTKSAKTVLGIAAEDATASDTSKLGVVPALPGMLFKGQVIDITASSNAGALATLAQTHLGAKAGLAVMSGDTHYGVDVGSTSYQIVQIVELIDAVSTSGGLVGFVVLQAYRGMDI
jgi:hypothetical protein